MKAKAVLRKRCCAKTGVMVFPRRHVRRAESSDFIRISATLQPLPVIEEAMGADQPSFIKLPIKGMQHDAI